MARKWMLTLAVATVAGAGGLVAYPATAQSMYDGIGTGSSSAVTGPNYQYLGPNGETLSGPAPGAVIVTPGQPGAIVAPSDGGVGLSSPGMTQGYGVIVNPDSNSLQLAPDVNATQDRGSPFFDAGGE